jgi:hypothetical protein
MPRRSGHSGARTSTPQGQKDLTEWHKSWYFATKQQFLEKHSFIKKLVSSFFLCLLTLSITPRIILHDLVADHRDGLSGSSTNGTELFQAGFNCHFENFVAESPFTPTIEVSIDVPLSSFPPVDSIYLTHYFSQHEFFADLRGPPAC